MFGAQSIFGKRQICGIAIFHLLQLQKGKQNIYKLLQHSPQVHNLKILEQNIWG